MSTVKLTATQELILRNIRDHGYATATGFRGSAQHGGADRSFYSLIGKGFIDRVDGTLTEAGSTALAAAEAATEALRPVVRKRSAEEILRSRVDSAAAKFLAESRDGDVPFEPTDENLAMAFSRAVKPIAEYHYSAVRDRVNAIRAERDEA